MNNKSLERYAVCAINGLKKEEISEKGSSHKENMEVTNMTRKCVVGRFDNNKPVTLSEDMTIQEALNSAGYNTGDNEEIQDVSGNEYDGTELALDGKAYFLVERIKSGC